MFNNKLTGVFIVPTGIGASIGGYAGDAGAYARKFARYSNLIVNPNVVNAGCFSAICDSMLYVEGYSINEFFKSDINLLPSKNNKIGVIYDKSIPQEVLNIHINTQNAVKTVYGTDIAEMIVTDEPVGVEFYIAEDGFSTGRVNNISTVYRACDKLIKMGCSAIAIVCRFDDSFEDNPEYQNGVGADPVGGVEAIISHAVSKEFMIPCAHSPAFDDYNIYPDAVNPKSAAEYITPTFLPCILLGLENAPKLTADLSEGLNVKDVDFLVMPCDCLGAVPVFEAVKRNIPVYAVKENSTILDVTKDKLFPASCITEVDTYEQCLNMILKS